MSLVSTIIRKLFVLFALLNINPSRCCAVSVQDRSYRVGSSPYMLYKSTIRVPEKEDKIDAGNILI